VPRVLLARIPWLDHSRASVAELSDRHRRYLNSGSAVPRLRTKCKTTRIGGLCPWHLARTTSGAEEAGKVVNIDRPEVNLSTNAI